MRRAENDISKADSDSFLDIITNLIGVLTLVAAVIALNLKDVTIPYGTPITHEPPAELKRVNIHCSKSQVQQIEPQSALFDELVKQALNGEQDATWRDLMDLTKPNPIRVKRFLVWADASPPEKRRTGSTGTWQSRQIQFEMQPRENASEEGDGWELDFRKSLAGLDPAEEYLFFFVDTDSFPEFRRARELAREQGFRTGFMPGDYKTLNYDLDDKNRNSPVAFLND